MKGTVHFSLRILPALQNGLAIRLELQKNSLAFSGNQILRTKRFSTQAYPSSSHKTVWQLGSRYNIVGKQVLLTSRFNTQALLTKWSSNHFSHYFTSSVYVEGLERTSACCSANRPGGNRMRALPFKGKAIQNGPKLMQLHCSHPNTCYARGNSGYLSRFASAASMWAASTQANPLFDLKHLIARTEMLCTRPTRWGSPFWLGSNECCKWVQAGKYPVSTAFVFPLRWAYGRPKAEKHRCWVMLAW